ncbi:MAG TPA: HAD family hydrolase [Spirochaetales bacterium]|nr:HAD family hydrolase [Spirochaetales bacterium]
MVVYSIPLQPKALIFDMDGTLYTNDAYLRWQDEAQIRRFAEALSITEEEARVRVDMARKNRVRKELSETSLAELLMELGIPLSTLVKWREEAFVPAEWLKPDPLLKITLDNLAARFKLVLLTNNPHKVGVETLRVLGVRSCFSVVRGLDDSGVAKPSAVPFQKTCQLLALSPSSCVSIGDRKKIDIDPALSLGMGAVLVDGVADVLSLSKLFKLP